MAELNLKQIIDRLNEAFTGDTRKLVFWEPYNHSSHRLTIGGCLHLFKKHGV